MPSVCSVICGDGLLVSGHEECDDGNIVSEDGCSSSCKSEPPKTNKNNDESE